MVNGDVSQILQALEFAVDQNSSTTISVADALKLRRHLQALKEGNTELNRKIADMSLSSIPMDDARAIAAERDFWTEEYRELAKKLSDLEFSGRKFNCPVCSKRIGHSESCWLGLALARKNYI